MELFLACAAVVRQDPPLPLRAFVNRVVFFENFILFVKTFSKPFEKGDPSSSLINQPPKIEDSVCLSQKIETGLNLSMKSIDQHCNQKSFVSTKHQDNCGLQVAVLLFPIVSCVSEKSEFLLLRGIHLQLLEESMERIRALEPETEKWKAESVKLQETSNFSKERANTAL